jgi:hypothetical protein
MGGASSTHGKHEKCIQKSVCVSTYTVDYNPSSLGGGQINKFPNPIYEVLLVMLLGSHM